MINTRVERARLYFRHRPSPVTLLSDPDCRTHRAFGVPRIEFIAEGSSQRPEWLHRTSTEQFQAARINPTGELHQLASAERAVQPAVEVEQKRPPAQKAI